MPTVNVNVSTRSRPTDLSKNDRTLIGTHRVHIDESVHTSKVASAALDIFNARFTFDDEESFDLSVATLSGEPLHEDTRHVPNSLSGTGRVLG